MVEGSIIIMIDGLKDEGKDNGSIFTLKAHQ